MAEVPAWVAALEEARAKPDEVHRLIAIAWVVQNTSTIAINGAGEPYHAANPAVLAALTLDEMHGICENRVHPTMYYAYADALVKREIAPIRNDTDALVRYLAHIVNLPLSGLEYYAFRALPPAEKQAVMDRTLELWPHTPGLDLMFRNFDFARMSNAQLRYISRVVDTYPGISQGIVFSVRRERGDRNWARNRLRSSGLPSRLEAGTLLPAPTYRPLWDGRNMATLILSFLTPGIDPAHPLLPIHGTRLRPHTAPPVQDEPAPKRAR